MKAEAKTQGSAQVIAKVIRADGTEETFVSEDVTVTEAKRIESFLRDAKLPAPKDTRSAEAEARNAEESRRNEEANRAEISRALAARKRADG